MIVMKKYLQITVVLLFFGTLVLLRKVVRVEVEQPMVVRTNQIG